MGQDFTVCFHFCCFSKGKFELETVWHVSTPLPYHLPWQRQWSQKSSSLQLHLPCKGCQKTWFSPVAKLPKNSEPPAGWHPSSGCMAESVVVLISRGRGRAPSPTVWCRFWHGIQWSLCCQMEEMELSGSPGFQDFWKGHVVTWYLKPISSNSASNELKRVWSMEEARIPEGGRCVAFSRVRNCWVLQQCRLSTWPPDENSSIRQLFGRQQSDLVTIFFPLLNYQSVSWVPSGQNYLLSF